MNKKEEEKLMNNLHRRKGRFTQRWLKDSEAYYFPLLTALFEAHYNNLSSKGYKYENIPILENIVGKSILEEDVQDLVASLPNDWRPFIFLSFGFDDFMYLIESVNSLNRSFLKLLEAGEPLSAMALIRLQLDNLTYIAAERKYPSKILYKVYFKKKQLADIKIANKNIMPSAIRKELDDLFGLDLNELYDTYSSYVHPNHQQKQMLDFNFYRLIGGERKITKKQIKEFTADMVYINQIITALIKDMIHLYKFDKLEDKSFIISRTQPK